MEAALTKSLFSVKIAASSFRSYRIRCFRQDSDNQVIAAGVVQVDGGVIGKSIQPGQSSFAEHISKKIKEDNQQEQRLTPLADVQAMRIQTQTHSFHRTTAFSITLRVLASVRLSMYAAICMMPRISPLERSQSSAWPAERIRRGNIRRRAERFSRPGQLKIYTRWYIVTDTSEGSPSTCCWVGTFGHFVRVSS